MRWIALAALLAATPVEAHCYSRWYYPWPQRCGVARQMVRFRQSPPISANGPDRANVGQDGPDEPEIPLPSLARADFDGGEADEPTRARVLLRAALEAR